MIQVTVGTNTRRTKITVDPNSTTLRQVLEAQEVNYATANVVLDGCNLQPGELDKTFTDMGVKDSCYLTAVVKTDNA